VTSAQAASASAIGFDCCCRVRRRWSGGEPLITLPSAHRSPNKRSTASASSMVSKNTSKNLRRT
jgi:hypothetical protein